MTLSLDIKDPKNVIKINQELCTKVSIKIKGSNNSIFVGPNTILKNLKIEIEANHSKIIIGDNCKIIGHLRIASGNKQLIEIGDKTTFQNVYLLSMEANSKISIGNNCMFSRNIEVRNSDAHSVIDITSGKRLNSARDVSIGNHVWVGAKVFITKGAQIPDDSIVGAASFVSKKFTTPNIILAGNPATIIKTGVTWSRSRQEQFTFDEMNAWKML